MPDVGRFFNVDPLAEDYAYQSPYNFAENQVIAFVELEGLEKGLPWYLNENKQGGKPVLTLGAHNIKLPYAQRREYKGNIIQKADTFIGNTLGSIYNGVASSWNDAMEGKTAGQMAQEGDRDMETTIRDAERNGVKMEHIEAIATIAIVHKTKLADIPKPNKGKGSVAPQNRDPKRTLTQKEKTQLINEKGAKCEGCGTDVNTKTSDAHHTVRHADGGATTKENTNILCKDCHKEIHK